MKRAILFGALFCIAAYQLLDELKIQHEYLEVPGVSHNYRALYDALGEKAFAFYVRAFGKLAKEQATPLKGGPAERKPLEQARQQNQLARLELAWVEPDKTEPAGARYKTFPSKTIKGDVSYLIYLPPDHEKEKDRRYPVLYWLHGTGGKQSRGGEVVKRLDEAIRNGKAPPMILVLVNGLRGATMYCDTRDGKWPLESVMVNDLVPHIDTTYRTIARRESRAVEGFSMGGFGAAHLGFKYPEVFGVVSILAPTLLTGSDLTSSLPHPRWPEHFLFVFNEDLELYQANNPFQLIAKNAGKLRGRSVIRLVPHDESEKWLIPRCRELHALLDKHKIPHEFDVREDVKEHNYRLLYDAMGERAFGFYAKAFTNISPGGKAAGEVTVTIGEKTMTAMKSQWADYFGSHYANSPDGAGTVWNTVRSYGGAHTGIHVAENKDAPVRKGPFTGKEVRIQLSDFHAARGGKSAEQLIPELIEHRITGIYLMTDLVRPGTEQPFDKDRAYWAVRLIHEKFPKANQQVVWQIGNEVVSGHFDPKGVWKAMTQEEKQRSGMKEDNFFGYDLKWKEEFYVNEYLAPAIEAIERASKDVYGDPRKIRIALGSMNPYNKPNLVFLKNVMERKFDGKQAPTLKGEVVWKHIALLTVHYMTGSPGTIATLQQYHDDYLKTGKVKGIWITEDHGRAGLGPVTIIDRGLRFLAWVARNKLSGEQTRLCWWGEEERDPGGQGKEATALFGEFFTGRKLYFASQAVTGGTVYTLSDSNDGGVQRMLIALAPDRGSSIKLDKLRLKLPPSKTPRQWVVEAIQYSATTPGKKLSPRSENIQGGLVIDWDRDVAEPMLLLLKTGR